MSMTYSPLIPQNTIGKHVNDLIGKYVNHHMPLNRIETCQRQVPMHIYIRSRSYIAIADHDDRPAPRANNPSIKCNYN